MKRVPDLRHITKRGRSEETLRIVVFHNILESLASPYLFDWNRVSCDIEGFKRILAFISDRFHVTNYEQFKNSEPSDGRPPLMMAFSDGYRSVHSIALPYIESMNLTATVFLPAGYIGKKRMLWWDLVMLAVKLMGMKEFFHEAFSRVFYHDSVLRYHVNDNNHAQFIKVLMNFLERLPNEELISFTNHLEEDIAQRGNWKNEERLLLNWEEVRELANSSFELGSHIVHNLGIFPLNADKFTKELIISKRDIEENTGKQVSAFCYPREDLGCDLDSPTKILQQENFVCGITTNSGINLPGFNPYFLKSLSINRDTYDNLSNLSRRLSGDTSRKLSAVAGLPAKYVQETVSKCKLCIRLHPSQANLIKLRMFKNNYPCHIFFTICDHFEPYTGRVGHSKALSRALRFQEQYMKVTSGHRDSDNFIPKVTVFYPIEEYRREILNILTDLQKRGFVETEVHLHHDKDTPRNLSTKLLDYKRLLASEHGLLSIDSDTAEISYGFIHGNWALDNSGPEGRWCGVNEEISVLEQTGCFADFTMPSAPHSTQTKKVNSIYYAVDNPLKPKSHDTGTDACIGVEKTRGLMMVQGPLTFRLDGWKLRIENGEISHDNPPSPRRIDAWIQQAVSVKGKADWIFCKLYTHGAQDSVMTQLFDNGWYERMFSYLEENYNDGSRYILHYVSAREMANIIKALENGYKKWSTGLRDFRYRRIDSANLI
jgi:peptidoglycan/xylan/chitin deacetylase (PgdA/CDA1 family)